MDIYIVTSYFEGLHEKIILYDDIITSRPDVQPEALESALESTRVPELSHLVTMGSCIIFLGYFVYRLLTRSKK